MLIVLMIHRLNTDFMIRQLQCHNLLPGKSHPSRFFRVSRTAGLCALTMERTRQIPCNGAKDFRDQHHRRSLLSRRPTPSTVQRSRREPQVSPRRCTARPMMTGHRPEQNQGDTVQLAAFQLIAINTLRCVSHSRCTGFATFVDLERSSSL